MPYEEPEIGGGEVEDAVEVEADVTVVEGGGRGRSRSPRIGSRRVCLARSKCRVTVVAVNRH